MNNPDDLQLELLLDQLWMDRLGPNESAGLQRILAADPAAQKRYLEVVALRESLPYLLGREPTPSEAPPRADAANPLVGREQSVKPSSHAPPRRWNFLSAWRRREQLATWAAAASVALLCTAAASSIGYRLGARQAVGLDRPSDVDLRAVTSTPPTPFAQDRHLGKISGLSLDASAHGLLRSMQVGQDLRCGEVVQLSAGFIRVKLASGPELILEGPTEFSLVGESRVFVRVGKLSAAGGQALVIQTPLLTAECRDAQALFDVADDDSASVYAAAGIVTLRSTPQEGGLSEKVRVLQAGEGLLVRPGSKAGSLRTSPGGAVAGAVDSWRQVELRLRPYERTVLADRPVAYWPLYQVRRNRRVLDLTQNGYDGQPIGNWPAESQSLGLDDQRGAYFNGECYIEPDRKPRLDPQRGFAVEGWAMVEGDPQFKSIFTSRWVLRSHEPDCQMFGFTLYAGDQDNWEFWSGNGRKGELWQKLVTPTKIDRSLWTHVVATFTPTGRPQVDEIEGAVRLYVNGRQAVEGVHQISLTDFEWPARIGAAEYVPRYLTSWLFKGRLRDIAVYDYPLEADEVNTHYQAGQSDSEARTTALPLPTAALLASLEGAWK
ncbi:MAG: LamG domain-containing protein [Pirellulales bacterium]|nr:LamG domain-containing protein [Pirellulales bacterium]